MSTQELGSDPGKLLSDEPLAPVTGYAHPAEQAYDTEPPTVSPIQDVDLIDAEFESSTDTPPMPEPGPSIFSVPFVSKEECEATHELCSEINHIGIVNGATFVENATMLTGIAIALRKVRECTDILAELSWTENILGPRMTAHLVAKRTASYEERAALLERLRNDLISQIPWIGERLAGYKQAAPGRPKGSGNKRRKAKVSKSAPKKRSHHKKVVSKTRGRGR
jgi:hypothetical protein